jgi:hypothetical protein
MAYVTVSELKRYLGIDVENAIDDALLSDMVQRAQAVVNTFTRRTFEATADEMRVHGWGLVDGACLFLDGDLCAVTSVVNGDGATLQATEYFTMPRNRAPFYALQLRPAVGYVWDGATGDILVTGRWAYSLTPPADVVQATVRLAAWLYRQKDNTGADSPMLAGDTMILPSRLPADVVELLRPYQRLLV